MSVAPDSRASDNADCSASSETSEKSAARPFDDHACGLPDIDQNVHRNISGRGGGKLVSRQPTEAIELADVLAGRRHTSHGKRQRCKHVERADARFVETGHHNGLIDRLPRGVGEIDRAQDASDLHFSSNFLNAVRRYVLAMSLASHQPRRASSTPCRMQLSS